MKQQWCSLGRTREAEVLLPSSAPPAVAGPVPGGERGELTDIGASARAQVKRNPDQIQRLWVDEKAVPDGIPRAGSRAGDTHGCHTKLLVLLRMCGACCRAGADRAHEMNFALAHRSAFGLLGRARSRSCCRYRMDTHHQWFTFDAASSQLWS